MSKIAELVKRRLDEVESELSQIDFKLRRSNEVTYELNSSRLALINEKKELEKFMTENE